MSTDYKKHTLEWWLNYNFESYYCWRIGGAYFYYKDQQFKDKENEEHKENYTDERAIVEEEVSALGQYKYYEIGCGTRILGGKYLHKE